MDLGGLNTLCDSCRWFIGSFEYDLKVLKRWSEPRGCKYMRTMSGWIQSHSHLRSSVLKLRKGAAGGCHLCKILVQHVLAVTSEAENSPIDLKPHLDPNARHLGVSVGTSGVEISIYIGRCLFRHLELENEDFLMASFKVTTPHGMRRAVPTRSDGPCPWHTSATTEAYPVRFST
jgi:hypothetical protein